MRLWAEKTNILVSDQVRYNRSAQALELIRGFKFGIWKEDVVLGFYVPPTAKVIRRQDLGLKSHPKDWRSPGSNSGPLVYKAGSLTARPRRLLRKKRDCLNCIAKTKVLICFVVTVICIFFFFRICKTLVFPWRRSEQRHEKTNILVSDQVRHKLSCTGTRSDKRLEIWGWESRGTV